MSYVCGKSSNKIVHWKGCRYVKMMPEKNNRYFKRLKDATEAGYKQCKYCARIKMYLRKEEKQLEEFCGANGLYYYFNPPDGSLDVISRSGRWKIIVNGHKHPIWLYHKNRWQSNAEEMIPGYHTQRIHCSTLMEYMNYIAEHDLYRERDPLFEWQKHPDTVRYSKKWKKEQKRASKMQRTQRIRYVNELLDGLKTGKILE